MESATQTVLILTPVKNATGFLETYFAGLDKLSYPQRLTSLGFLESDSDDATYERIRERIEPLRCRYASAEIWQKQFNFRMPPGLPRSTRAFEIPRRKILAKARNHLLFHALKDHDWVLWLDVDVIDYPPDLIERLIATGRDIVHPHCVQRYGGPTFDLNAWREHGRVHMDDLRGGSDLVRLDAVGGTVLLVRADLHRDGLIFPCFPYGAANPAVRRPGPLQINGELETEGFGIMAMDMGYQCWGIPNLEVLHAQDWPPVDAPGLTTGAGGAPVRTRRSGRTRSECDQPGDAKFLHNAFEARSFAQAMSLTVTPEFVVSTQQRWEKETTYHVDDIGTYLALGRDTTVLDYGCGTGRIAKGLIERYGCQVIGCDSSQSMRLWAPEYVCSERFSVWSPTLLDQLIADGFRADYCISLWVIQHVLDPNEVIDRLHRVLRPGGLLYSLNQSTRSVPTDQGWIDDGIDVRANLCRVFDEENFHAMPETVVPSNLVGRTMIQILRRRPG